MIRIKEKFRDYTVKIKVTCNVRIIVENSIKYHNPIQFCKDEISLLREECGYKVVKPAYKGHSREPQKVKMYPL